MRTILFVTGKIIAFSRVAKMINFLAERLMTLLSSSPLNPRDSQNLSSPWFPNISLQRVDFGLLSQQFQDVKEDLQMTLASREWPWTSSPLSLHLFNSWYWVRLVASIGDSSDFVYEPRFTHSVGVWPWANRGILVSVLPVFQVEGVRKSIFYGCDRLDNKGLQSDAYCHLKKQLSLQRNRKHGLFWSHYKWPWPGSIYSDFPKYNVLIKEKTHGV